MRGSTGIDRTNRFFDTCESSDVSVICGEHEFHVHKIILLSYESHFFSAVLRGNFGEAHTSRIEIKDEEPAVVAGILYWFYRGRIPAPNQYPSKLEASDDHAKHYVLLYAIACKFGIPGLRNCAAHDFMQTFQWKGVYRTTSIWHVDQAWADSLVWSIYGPTSTVEKGLRNIVVMDILEESKENPAFSCKIAKLLSSIPELAFDVTTRYIHREMPRDCTDEADRARGIPRVVRPCEAVSEDCRKNHRREPSPAPTPSS